MVYVNLKSWRRTRPLNNTFLYSTMAKYKQAIFLSRSVKRCLGSLWSDYHLYTLQITLCTFVSIRSL